MGLKNRWLLAVFATAAVVAALLPSSAAAANTASVIAWGFDSPRGITFVGSKGLVAEAGHGSDNPADCFTTPFGNTCVGNTSRISWVNTTTHGPTPLTTGIFSIALDPVETIGVSGLSYRSGKIYAQIGATSREVPAKFAIGQEAGDLIKVNPNTGSWTTIAQVGDDMYDYTVNNFPIQPNPKVCGQCPGTQEHDANPNDVLATSNGWLVADSGANTLTRVSKNGTTKVLAYFGWRDPTFTNFPSDEVPTCLARTDDGIWIGTLAGHLFRYEEGKALLVATPKDSAGNPLLTHVTGCTSRGETLYLANMFGPGTFGSPMFINGSVVKYNTESRKGSVLATAFSNPAFFLPYSAKFGPDGNLYVTSGAICGFSGASPFPGAPFNPCTLSNPNGGPDMKGGRVLKITLANSGEHD